MSPRGRSLFWLLCLSVFPTPPQVVTVRLPTEGGGSSRLRGFGYTEFAAVTDLMEALNMTGEVRGVGQAEEKGNWAQCT